MSSSTISAELTSTSSSGQKHIPRPPNCFMLFRSAMVEEYRRTSSGKKLPQQSISGWVSKLWKDASPEVKRKFEQLAEEAKTEHARVYPGYKYKPSRPKSNLERKGHCKSLTKGKERVAITKSKKTETIASAATLFHPSLSTDFFASLPSSTNSSTSQSSTHLERQPNAWENVSSEVYGAEPALTTVDNLANYGHDYPKKIKFHLESIVDNVTTWDHEHPAPHMGLPTDTQEKPLESSTIFYNSLNPTSQPSVTAPSTGLDFSMLLGSKEYFYADSSFEEANSQIALARDVQVEHNYPIDQNNVLFHFERSVVNNVTNWAQNYSVLPTFDNNVQAGLQESVPMFSDDFFQGLCQDDFLNNTPIQYDVEVGYLGTDVLDPSYLGGGDLHNHTTTMPNLFGDFLNQPLRQSDDHFDAKYHENTPDFILQNHLGVDAPDSYWTEGNFIMG